MWPDPLIHPDTDPFWKGLAQGELRIQLCTSCGTYRFPFAPVCFQCLSFAHAWEAIAPEGTVAVAVVVHRATGDAVWSSHVPFLSGLVAMERGIRLPGRIVCACGEALRRGTPVRAVASPPVHVFAHACVELT